MPMMQSKFQKETKIVQHRGKQMVIENLTPILPPKEREQRRKEIEQELFSVLVKYQDKKR